ncbi:hypothetical protein BASA81_004049 [Batrachochytrium salamandrivorans]|nr:hypothetical protein BASA81_004049 [Batrachochytrium salamandrivorans]
MSASSPQQQPSQAPPPPPSLLPQTQGKPLGGWMERRVGWKRHYFAMEPNTLVEYFDLQGGGTSKFYPLAQISDVLIDDGNKFVFSFRFHKLPNDHAKAKPVYFRVANAEEMEEWVSKLRVAVMAQNGPTTPPKTSTSPEFARRVSVATEVAAVPAAVVADAAPLFLGRSRGASATSTAYDAHEEDTDRSDEDDSSDSGDSDFHFDSARQEQQQQNWGSRMKRFLSRSGWDESENSGSASLPATTTMAVAGGSSELAVQTDPVPPTQYDLRTFQVVEYDLVEVFENQRWFPIGGWTAKKSLLSDRAHFTSRHGHNRTNIFRSGSDANEATLGNEDRHEIPGTQVHVIKEPWQWDSPQWQLQPLIGMQRIKSSRHKASLDSDDQMGSGLVYSDHNNSNAPLSTLPGTPIMAPSATTSAAATTSSSSRAPWMKSFSRMSTAGSAVAGNGSSSKPLQPATSEMQVSTAINQSVLTEDGGGNHSDSSWSLGFDFTDFDHAIARGVPKKHPPLMTSNVRCRRWVRLRKRIINLTARLPENDQLAFKLFPALASFQRQVICEGWLGTSIRRVWKSRYLKLVRICDGSWDNGQGRGLVSRPPLAIQLICYECKERCNMYFEGIATFAIEPNSVARLAVANLSKAEDGEDAHCLTLTKNRFSTPPQQMAGVAVVLDGSEDASFQVNSLLEDSKWSALATSVKLEKPRSGRFEFVLNRDKTFIFSADTSEDSLVWVNCLNRAAQEIKQSLPTTPATEALAVVGKGGKKGLFGLVKNIRHHRHVMESDSDVDGGEGGEDGAGMKNLELDDLVPAPPSVSIDLHQTSSLTNQGKLKEWEDFEMKCSLGAFFTLFYGDNAKYGMKEHHVDMGDFDFTNESWTVPTEPNPKFPKDDFDFDGFSQVPARLLQMQSYTKSPVGVAVTRVEKHQRYYYYPQDHMLVVKSTTKSLDVPFGDSFAVFERWVVTSDAGDLNKVRVRIYLEAVFSKPAGFIGATIKRLIHVQIPKSYLQWKKRAFAVIRGLSGASIGNAQGGDGEGGEGNASQPGAEGRLGELVKKLAPVAEAMWQERASISQAVFALYLMWWMHALLLVMVRLVEALDRSGGGRGLQ